MKNAKNQRKSTKKNRTKFAAFAKKLAPIFAPIEKFAKIVEQKFARPIAKKLQNLRPWQKELAKILFWATIFALFFAICARGIDVDFGWHLANGRYILTHGFPRNDVFSFTMRDHPALPTEWLNDVFMAKIYDSFGYVFLAFLFAGGWTIALFLAARRTSPAVTLAVLLAFVPFLGTRTEFWMVLFLAILLEILRAKNQKIRWLVPLFVVFWLQVHGSFALVFAVLGWWAIFLARTKKERRNLAIILLLSLGASFLSPYGAGVWRELLDMATDSELRWQISEWNPLPSGAPLETLPFLAIFGATAIWRFVQISQTSATKTRFFSRATWRNFWSRKDNRTQTFRELEWPFLAAGLASVRNFPLFAVVSAENVDRDVREIRHKIIPWREMKSAQKFVLAALVGAMIAVGGWMLWRSIPSSGDIFAGFPIKSAAWLEKNGCPGGNLFNDYGAGGFLIWKAPHVKVFIDGRVPSWRNKNGEKYMNIYGRVLSDRKFRMKIFARDDIKCALVGRGSDIARDLKKLGWRKVIVESGYVLLRAR